MKNPMKSLCGALGLFCALTSVLAHAEMTEDVIDAVDMPPEKVEVVAAGEGEDNWPLVDVVCDNAKLSDIVTQFRRATKANIICANLTNLDARVSVTLTKANWVGALRAILETNGFKLDRRDGVFYVHEDTGEPPKIVTRSFLINHASTEDVAKLLNAMYSREVEGEDAEGSSVSKKVEIARPFTASNTVIVRTDELTMEECATVIERLDKPVPQIYIEARFIELSSEAMHKLGLKWNALSEWGVGFKNIGGGIERNSGKAADYGTYLSDSTVSKNSTHTTTTGENATDTDTATENISQSLTGLAAETIGAATGAGRTDESMGWSRARGFQGQMSVDDFRLALSAFEQMSDAKLFSNPKIIVSNGKNARVDMTQKFPNVRVSSHRNTEVGTESIDVSAEIAVIPGDNAYDFAGKIFFDYGISLEVTPCIAPDGLISVSIVPTISNLEGYYKIGRDDESASPLVDKVIYSKYPIINMKRLITEFTMKDGSTAVIGGLTQTKEQDVDSGIPFLRKIPWIGPKLFGWKSREKVQTEILVFVTVGIADAANMDKAVGLPKNAVLGRDYVEGRAFEPGDRPGAENGAAWSLSLDMRGLDDRAKDPLTRIQKEDPEAVSREEGERVKSYLDELGE